LLNSRTRRSRSRSYGAGFLSSYPYTLSSRLSHLLPDLLYMPTFGLFRQFMLGQKGDLDLSDAEGIRREVYTCLMAFLQ
jgi:hypothetical protein